MLSVYCAASTPTCTALFSTLVGCALQIKFELNFKVTYLNNDRGYLSYKNILEKHNECGLATLLWLYNLLEYIILCIK